MCIRDRANVEGDLETLTELINNYKHNWDNDVYVQNSHKMVMDIKRTARSNMLNYQKKVAELVSSKKLLVAQGQVKSALTDMEKRFKYYRLSLYTYSLASMMEIMLGGNFKEEYITGIKDEIVKLSGAYRELFEKGSLYLEKLGEMCIRDSRIREPYVRWCERTAANPRLLLNSEFVIREASGQSKGSCCG